MLSTLAAGSVASRSSPPVALLSRTGWSRSDREGLDRLKPSREAVGHADALRSYRSRHFARVQPVLQLCLLDFSFSNHSFASYIVLRTFDWYVQDSVTKANRILHQKSALLK